MTQYAYLYHIKTSLIDFFCKSIDNLFDKGLRHKLSFKKLEHLGKPEVITSQLDS